MALYSLLPVYRGKVKLIYIDPPYNTGNDSFRYNDSFNHSTWLTFMKDRLKVARELLHAEGVICINIDDKEVYYLKVLCDEIFDGSNFLTNVVVKTSDPSGHKTVNPAPYSQSEYVLMYAKNKTQYKYSIHYVRSDYDEGYNKFVENIKDDYKSWSFLHINEAVANDNGFEDAKKAKKAIGNFAFEAMVAEFALKNKHRVFQPVAISDDAGKEIVKMRDESANNRGVVYRFSRDGKEDIYIYEGRQMYFYSSKVKVIDGVETPAKPLTNIWTDIPYNGLAREGNIKLKNGKKPEKLLRRLIEICTKPNDIVLDFFVGSGTTSCVALKINRRFIGVEQMEYIEELPNNRLINVINGEQSGISKVINWQGGGSFVYLELANANQHFVNKIQAAESEAELLELWQQMQAEAFISYKVTPDMIDKNAADWAALSIDDKKRFLVEALDKNLLYVPHCDMESKEFGMSEADKAATRAFYNLKYEA